MQKNVGKFDKKVRLFVGVIILVIGFYYQSWWGLFGVILIITGLMNYCPLYPALGKNSCKDSDKCGKKEDVNNQIEQSVEELEVSSEDFFSDDGSTDDEE